MTICLDLHFLLPPVAVLDAWPWPWRTHHQVHAHHFMLVCCHLGLAHLVLVESWCSGSGDTTWCCPPPGRQSAFALTTIGALSSWLMPLSLEDFYIDLVSWHHRTLGFRTGLRNPGSFLEINSFVYGSQLLHIFFQFHLQLLEQGSFKGPPQMWCWHGLTHKHFVQC